jgi:hypothetical protein
MIEPQGLSGSCQWPVVRCHCRKAGDFDRWGTAGRTWKRHRVVLPAGMPSHRSSLPQESCATGDFCWRDAAPGHTSARGAQWGAVERRFSGACNGLAIKPASAAAVMRSVTSGAQAPAKQAPTSCTLARRTPPQFASASARAATSRSFPSAQSRNWLPRRTL